MQISAPPSSFSFLSLWLEWSGQSRHWSLEAGILALSPNKVMVTPLRLDLFFRVTESASPLQALPPAPPRPPTLNPSSNTQRFPRAVLEPVDQVQVASFTSLAMFKNFPNPTTSRPQVSHQSSIPMPFTSSVQIGILRPRERWDQQRLSGGGRVTSRPRLPGTVPVPAWEVLHLRQTSGLPAATGAEPRSD